MRKVDNRFIRLYSEMASLCDREGWGDPFSYARAKEILLSIKLGHTVSPTLSGADGIDNDGECEYKSTTASTLRATYTGISVLPTWKEQKEYLKNSKIGKYHNHYHSRFESGNIVECYRLSGRDVLKVLEPKLKKKYFSVSKRKDPRLSASLTRNEITKYGTRII